MSTCSGRPQRLAGLGLIGGAGTVIYNNNGDATVKIKDDRTRKVQTVRLGGAGGKSFSCPSGTREKFEPYDIRLGRIKAHAAACPARGARDREAISE